MGMSTHISAFTPDTDKEYQKHLKVFMVCKEAEISLPKETADYFGGNHPESWMLDEKLEVRLKEGEHFNEWYTDGASGFEVDLTKLPSGVTKLRFYNSW